MGSQTLAMGEKCVPQAHGSVFQGEGVRQDGLPKGGLFPVSECGSMKRDGPTE